jgi:hypothetical protein
MAVILKDLKMFLNDDLFQSIAVDSFLFLNQNDKNVEEISK